MNKLSITAAEFDRRFEEGESVYDLGFDPKNDRRPGLEIKRVNVDLPQHVIEKLDQEARLRGITRQALIKVVLFDTVSK